MQSFRDLTDQKRQQLSAGNVATKPAVNCTAVDRTLEMVEDLINPTFKHWYALQIMRLGDSRVLGIASDARRGKQPARLFSSLLKRARK